MLNQHHIPRKRRRCISRWCTLSLEWRRIVDKIDALQHQTSSRDMLAKDAFMYVDFGSSLNIIISKDFGF